MHELLEINFILLAASLLVLYVSMEKSVIIQ